MPAGFCAEAWTTAVRSPRGIYVAENNDVIVVSSATTSIYAVFDNDDDGVVDGTVTLASAPGLTHAVNYHDGYLYASSDSTLYRWKYTQGQRTSLGSYEVFVKNVPSSHHITRKMVWDREGRMYLQCGSEDNVAKNDAHSRIHRFDMSKPLPAGGFDWNTGEYFAGGLRNEVGIRFDEEDRLWGVENGRDDLSRSDLGGDIHNDNPAEELNLFDKNTPGRFYGYPYCWSVFKLQSYAAGTQFADPGFSNITDAWCRDTKNVVPPAFSFEAHMAPLDILFWPSSDTTWPKQFPGKAFISYHGSWDRQPPSGYFVEYVNITNGKVYDHSPFLGYAGAPIGPPRTWIRPVAMGIVKCPYGRCIVLSSDSTNQLILISYRP